MRKLILMTALASSLSFAGFAQQDNSRMAMREERQNMTPEQRAAKDAQWAEAKLGLNAEQKSKWQAASLERMNANEPLKNKMKGSTTPEEREQLRSQMKGNMDKFESTVAGFLTPEQKAKYDQEKTQRHGMRPMKKDKSAGQPTINDPTGK